MLVQEIFMGKAPLEFLFQYFHGHKFTVKGCSRNTNSTEVRRGLLLRALVKIARRMLRPFPRRPIYIAK